MIADAIREQRGETQAHCIRRASLCRSLRGKRRITDECLDVRGLEFMFRQFGASEVRARREFIDTR